MLKALLTFVLFFLNSPNNFFQEILLKIYSAFSSSFLPTSLSNHHHHHHYPPHSSISSKKKIFSAKQISYPFYFFFTASQGLFHLFQKKITKKSLHFLFSSSFATTSTPYTPVSSIRIPSTTTTLTFFPYFPKLISFTQPCLLLLSPSVPYRWLRKIPSLNSTQPAQLSQSSSQILAAFLLSNATAPTLPIPNQNYFLACSAPWENGI